MTLECIELRLDQTNLYNYLSKLEKASVSYGFTVHLNQASAEMTLQLFVDDEEADLKIRMHDGRWLATVLHPVIEMVPAAKKESQHADA